MFLWYSVDYWYIMEVILLMIGGIIMSIVISVCGVNFSLMMSDGRLVKINDMNSKNLTVVNEEFKKISRINRNVMIGFTGDPVPTINALNELNTYANLESLSLEEIKEIVVNSLKKQQINFLGVKLITIGIKTLLIISWMKYISRCQKRN